MEIPRATLSEIREKTLEKFGRRACLWQLKIAEAILKRDKDVVCIAGTGSGKTLTFWMPLLFRDGIQIVMTPLNILGVQSVAELNGHGIPAISIYSETATPQNSKDIESGKYRVVVIYPEVALGNSSASCGTRRIASAHGEASVQSIGILVACEISFHVPFPILFLRQLCQKTQSNDRPNVYLSVRKIEYALTSFRDLNF
ncbi:hypothetical protein NLI96_g6698 [Meripilus lineatus]|uniref:DNA 3'-5' helicase n=1 Tax=Meripilus lineatus TaxID=2056292 RepID=A0AAD5V2V8_9APHY|nr:hypothetical protein NLI96_g6698 [Physisporinus lineatus]